MPAAPPPRPPTLRELEDVLLAVDDLEAALRGERANVAWARAGGRHSGRSGQRLLALCLFASLSAASPLLFPCTVGQQTPPPPSLAAPPAIHRQHGTPYPASPTSQPTAHNPHAPAATRSSPHPSPRSHPRACPPTATTKQPNPTPRPPTRVEEALGVHLRLGALRVLVVPREEGGAADADLALRSTARKAGGNRKQEVSRWG